MAILLKSSCYKGCATILQMKDKAYWLPQREPDLPPHDSLLVMPRAVCLPLTQDIYALFLRGGYLVAAERIALAIVARVGDEACGNAADGCRL